MRKGKKTALSGLGSMDALVDYFDSHDLGDMLDDLPEEHFDVKLSKHFHLIPVRASIATRVAKVAHSRRTSSEELINSWLEEKLLDR